MDITSQGLGLSLFRVALLIGYPLLRTRSAWEDMLDGLNANRGHEKTSTCVPVEVVRFTLIETLVEANAYAFPPA